MGRLSVPRSAILQTPPGPRPWSAACSRAYTARTRALARLFDMSSKLFELFGLSAESPHLDEALSHPSYANEQGLSRHNQRLEFLGDSVLGLCVSELLFQRFPSADEGVLTSIR